MIEAILVEGLIYAVLALGVFISFRVLDFPDLTAEGAFPLGAAAAAALIGAGAHPALAVLAAFAAAALAGAATGAIYAAFKVPSLLAGIVIMTGLWSVNLRVLGGRANLPLIANNPIMDAAYATLPALPEWSAALFFALVVALVLALLVWFFSTEAGIAMGALGDNEAVVIAAGANPVSLRTAGVALSGGLCGLSGALAASYQGFADVNFGSGVVAAGLASVMVGELMLKSNRIGLQIVRVVLGSIMFRGLMFAGRSYGYLIGMTPNDLRFVTALLVIGAIALGRVRKKRRISSPAAALAGAAQGGAA
ncbi:MAG TPA: ABC transporter permease [Spirochaetaceae bacterium]|nr:ABC transporter permease [Spirochaetaceae bacterium]